jgi:two-component system, sensor histidine kinase and response regulator
MDKETKPLILIVDDNMKNLQVLGNILYKHGYDTAFATNGNEAIKYFDTELADLVLLDIMMPEIDGYKVCKILKTNNRTRSIPVIFLTAKTDKDSIVKGFEVGGVDYLTKPFNESELLARVATHIELKISKDKLIESQKQLLESNRTKDKFFSIIAHDLKNPLLGLVNISEALIDTDKKDIEQVNKLTDMLHDVVMNQYKLLENLLEWSNLQTKRRQINPEKCHIEELIDDIVSLYLPVANNKNITIIYPDTGGEHYMFADEKMIETVLRNIISNAIKFTTEGGFIHISLDERDNHQKIIVSDTGIGIDEKDIPKLFDMSVTHTTSGTNKEKGTGLGLILCKELVEMNKGEIKVASEKGKGSTFSVFLPVANT